jgi:endonuclease/exonuclease/phosphatase family metal-dependent hydrolase
MKLDQIAEAVGAQGSLPDIMTLEEVENSNVVGMLANRLGYKYHITTDGPDPRGIDVALMFNDTKLKYLSHEELPVSFSDPKNGSKPTRPILLVRFEMLGYTKGSKQNILAVYVNHWPSQAAPASKRYEVAKVLKSYIEKDRQNYTISNYHVVATGDFNTVEGDHPHPFYNVIVDPSWANGLTDVYELFKQSGSSMVDRMPLGSYFFMPEYSWQRLDRFFISSNLYDGIGVEVVPSSYRTVAAEFMTKMQQDDFSMDRHTYGSVIFGVPWRFNYNATSPSDAGYSDHFPVVMKIKY